MPPITLEAEQRHKDISAKCLRKSGMVPGILYGYGVENRKIACRRQDFHKAFISAGESTIINLNMGSKVIPVIIHSVDRNPVSDMYEHVDFFAPDMDKEITAKVSIVAHGESAGVKDKGGVLVTHRDAIEVKCLPGNLPHSIEIDLSSLEEIHDSISVADLNIPEAVSVLTDSNELVCTIEPPRKEEEIAPAASEAEEEEKEMEETGESTEKSSDKNKGEDDKTGKGEK